MNNKTLEELRKILANTRVKIVSLVNEEEHYGPGDIGSVAFVDDAKQVHISWDNGGSIALLPEEGDCFDYWMPNESIGKKVRDNFKKKRGKWDIDIAAFYSTQDAYVYAEKTFACLDTQFNEDEKEKYGYTKMKIGVTPMQQSYIVTVSYKR